MRNELFKGINKMENIECYLLVTNQGIMVCGNNIEIRAMFSQIAAQLKEHGFEEEEIKRAVEIGLMSNKERQKETSEKLDRIIEKLFGGKL